MIMAITKFIANNTGFVVGTTIMAEFRPMDAADRVQLVTGGGGSLVPELTDRADLLIQVTSRSDKEPDGSIWDAKDDADLIFAFLHGSSGWDLPEVVAGKTWRAMVITGVAPPQYLGIDKEGRHEYSTNYMFKIRAR